MYMDNKIAPSGYANIPESVPDDSAEAPATISSNEISGNPETSPADFGNPEGTSSDPTTPAPFKSLLSDINLGGQMRELQIRGLISGEADASPLTLFGDHMSADT